METNPTPPDNYLLDQVNISITHTTGHKLPGSYQINLDGSLTASRTVDRDKTNSISLSKDDFMEILNAFYKVHFFELQDTYTKQTSVALLEDNKIKTYRTKMMDTSSKRVCITLADYKKCITIVNNQPSVLTQVITKIENLF